MSTRPYDPRFPQVCLNQVVKQLLRDPQTPVLPAPDQLQHIDAVFERQSVVDRFLLREPLTGQRYVTVTDQHTKRDFA